MEPSKLSFDDFQEFVNATYYFVGDSKREELLYLALATNTEAGEMGDEIKKAMRDDNGQITPERLNNIKKELGDTLFYAANLCTVLDISFSEAAAAEMEKLQCKIAEWETKTGNKFNKYTYKQIRNNKTN